MNVQVNFDRKVKVLMSATMVPEGKVYSWGAMQSSYLRVNGGSVCLDNWDWVPCSHAHFGPDGPRVEIAQDANLVINYEA